MSNSKKKLALLCGGKSAEHEISIVSARNIYAAIDSNKYDIYLIVIDRQGNFCLRDASELHPSSSDKLIAFNDSPESWAFASQHGKAIFFQIGGKQSLEIDVVFPVLHGPNGEDGTVQGLMQLLGVPFVGPGVLASAVAMDKVATKSLLRDAGIPSAKFISFTKPEFDKFSYQIIAKELGAKVFVKPANMGSSVGVSCANNESEYQSAVKEALLYDRKVLVEQAIVGREIEVAVLGNDTLEASLPGEIRPAAKHGHYSYESKYLDASGAELIIPAKLSDSETAEVRKLAIAAATVIGCTGMVRVDLFFTPSGEFLINELNTIPGFTNISMYPKMWEATGLSYGKLIDRLINLAVERADLASQLKWSV